MGRKLLRKAKSAYRRGGLGRLGRRALRYLQNRLADQVVWAILPKAATLRAVAGSQFLTSLYFFFSGSFYREQRANLCGRAAYHELESERRKPRHRIIRSVHRLEKGLSMRDRRPVFGEGYIQELVVDLRTAWLRSKPDEQLFWAMDVLAEYFQAVDSTAVIDGAESEFRTLLEDSGYQPEGRSPFPRRALPEPPITINQLKQLARRRKSTRWFQEKSVPEDVLLDALEVAGESPSACNRQSYEFRFYDDPNLVNRLSKLALGATGYRRNIPCLAIIVGKQRAYFHIRDKHVIYIDASLAAMAFQLALETEGLASCCINWPAIPYSERRMEEHLGLDCDEQVVMLMAIGYPDPDGMVPYSKKKDPRNLCSFNTMPEAN